MSPAARDRRSVQPLGRTVRHLHAHGRLARCGFTLLELLLSLGLIAVVATFAISAFFSQSDMTLHNALELLSDDMHEMQARSSSLQIPVAILFDEDGGGYRSLDLGTADPARANLFPPVARRYEADAVFEGVRIRRLELGGSDRIVFDEGGHKPLAGTVVIGYRTEARVLQLRADRGFTCLPDSPPTRGWLDALR
jgi:prepilin-type N-terminal cleavage/methylation domain-containing protein